MSDKRAINATAEVLERQYQKMFFVHENLQKELEDLSPGKTIGKQGEKFALRDAYVLLGNSLLVRAINAYRSALETYQQ